MHLSLKEAQTVIEFAHAETIGVPMNIAVVDAGGHLLAFVRMDKAILGSIDIALKKAKTPVMFNNPSEFLWESSLSVPLTAPSSEQSACPAACRHRTVRWTCSTSATSRWRSSGPSTPL